MRALLTTSRNHALSATRSTAFDEVFLWDMTKDSTFTCNIDPHLKHLGEINQYNSDFVRVALGILAADRSYPRNKGSMTWSKRKFLLTVEVSDIAAWASVSHELSSLVAFLSGDEWEFIFVELPDSEEKSKEYDTLNNNRVLLFSGGADSAAGALLSAASMANGESQALVSHFGPTTLSKKQKELTERLSGFNPEITNNHFQFQLNRKSQRLNGDCFKNEYSTRTRSLLFISLGLAIASCSDVPLWIAENGFASLNPPLGADRRGSLSTKTTHPLFLDTLSELLLSIGGFAKIENPFERKTKGEMFTEVRESIGIKDASAYLSATHSCSHTDARFHGGAANSSCGVCFGCLVRKSAFTSSGIPDSTDYLSYGTNEKLDKFLDNKTIVEAMKTFTRRGISNEDIIAMSLPSRYKRKEALDLCQRGTEELRELMA